MERLKTLKNTKKHFIALMLIFSFFSTEVFAKDTSIESVAITPINSNENFEQILEDQEKNLKDADNFISVTNSSLYLKLTKNWESLLKTPNLRIVQIESLVQKVKKTPRGLKTHLKDQVDFYKNDKVSVVMLSVLTVNSAAMNWLFMSEGTAAETAAIIVGINAILYAYIGTNIPNWRRLLAYSTKKVEKLKALKPFKNLSDESSVLISGMTTNFAYYFVYNYAIQGILNIDNISKILNLDLLGLILKNSAFGVFSSGLWDPVFERWIKAGHFSEKTAPYLYHTRSIFMGALTNLAAVGVSESYYVMGLSGGAAVFTLSIGHPKVQNLRDRIVEKINLKHLLKKKSAPMMCRSFL